MIPDTIKKMEKMFNIKPSEVGEHIGVKTGAVYYQRKKHPERYKIILLGIRMYKSPLKAKDILNQIEPVEKLIERTKGKN